MLIGIVHKSGHYNMQVLNESPSSVILLLNFSIFHQMVNQGLNVDEDTKDIWARQVIS